MARKKVNADAKLYVVMSRQFAGIRFHRPHEAKYVFDNRTDAREFAKQHNLSPRARTWYYVTPVKRGKIIRKK